MRNQIAAPTISQMCADERFPFLFQVRDGPENEKVPRGRPHPRHLPIDPQTCRYTAKAIKRDSSVFGAPLETPLYLVFILYRF